jgi:hypothetical protein
LLEKFGGGFFADSGDAGDVVGFVADEGFVVDVLFGRDAKPGFDFVGAVEAGFGQFLPGEADADVFVAELEEVAVAGGDDDFDALGGGLFGDGSQHVVGFVVVGGEDGDVEGGDDFVDAFDLVAQVVGHFFARAFVVGEEAVAEGCAHVETYGEVVGLFLFEDVEEDGGEAVGSGGGFTGFGDPAGGVAAHGGEGEVGAVGEGVAVDEV